MAPGTRRAQWLAAWLERELLGDLLVDLRTGAELPESATFVRVEETLDALAEKGGQVYLTTD